VARGAASFGAGLRAGSQSPGPSRRSSSGCPSSWVPVPGRKLYFGVHPEAIPLQHPWCLLVFTRAVQKRERRGKKMHLRGHSTLSPSADRSVPNTPTVANEAGPCHSLGTSTSSLTFCPWSGCHICPRANSPVLLQAPSRCTQAPCGERCPRPSLGMEVASHEATPATHSQCQVAMTRDWDALQEHHMASITLAPALGLCFVAGGFRASQR